MAVRLRASQAGLRHSAQMHRGGGVVRQRRRRQGGEGGDTVWVSDYEVKGVAVCAAGSGVQGPRVLAFNALT